MKHFRNCSIFQRECPGSVVLNQRPILNLRTAKAAEPQRLDPERGIQHKSACLSQVGQQGPSKKRSTPPRTSKNEHKLLSILIVLVNVKIRETSASVL